MFGLETGGEMAGIGEAAGDGDLGDGEGRVPQELTRGFQADRAIMVGEALAQVLAEQTVELAGGEPDMARDLAAVERLAQIVLHEL